LIVIVDYGMGNLGSIANIIRKVGGDPVLSESVDDLLAAEKLILPGVGAFGNGMAGLRDRGLVEPLTEMAIARGTPILGICLGMQLFTRGSEEDTEAGLGWIDAETVRFQPDPTGKLKIPHMGWSALRVVGDHPCFAWPDKPRRFYFVHSYHVRCHDPADVLATATYGIEFTSAIARDNIVGVQFHPEKSHRFGMELMENFVHRIPARRT